MDLVFWKIAKIAHAYVLRKRLKNHEVFFIPSLNCLQVTKYFESQYGQ